VEESLPNRFEAIAPSTEPQFTVIISVSNLTTEKYLLELAALLAGQFNLYGSIPRCSAA